MTTDLEIRPASDMPLTAQMDYARAVASANVLPDAYRGKPADILIAVGLGSSMGLSPAESLYRISVIKGKPTASAELIASNVRKAGHKLRVRGDDTSCTATILRADDPDFEFTVTRDLAWAQKMGLAGNDNYKKQPGTMLQWRAITAVARLACPEALYGVSYTPDEAADFPEQPQQPTRGLAAALSRDEPEVTDAEIVPEPEAVPEPDAPLITAAQSRMLHALLNEHGYGDRQAGLDYLSRATGREITTSKDLTKAEATRVIDGLQTPAEPEDEPLFDGGAE